MYITEEALKDLEGCSTTVTFSECDADIEEFSPEEIESIRKGREDYKKGKFTIYEPK